MSEPTETAGAAQPPARRPAPASERVEQTVSAPAHVAKPRDASGAARAKVELRVEPTSPSEPPAGAGPQPAAEDVVVEAVRRLPEASSRRAKTEVRLQRPGEAPPVPLEADITGPGLPGPTRTVGGRTERLAPVAIPGAGPAVPGAPAGVDPAAVGQILARTIGGRTERHLPAAHEPAAALAAPSAMVAGVPPVSPAVAAARLVSPDESGAQRAQSRPAGARWLIAGVLLVAVIVLGSLAAAVVWQRSNAVTTDSGAEPSDAPTTASDPGAAAAEPVATSEPTAETSEPPGAEPTATPRSKTAASPAKKGSTKTPATKPTSDLLFDNPTKP